MSISPRTLRPSSFSPRSISGLALWLDASSTDSLYTTDAGPVVAVNDPLDIAGCALWLDGADATSITASGGEVTAWADKSASALSFTAAGTPVTGSHTLNGRNVIRFDNVADLLSATSATRLGITSSYTVFTVARYTTVQTSMLMSIGRSVSPNTNGLTLYYNAGLRTIEKRDAAWGTDMVVSGSLATANAALLATGTRSGTDQRIMRDGMLAGSTAGSTGNIAWGDTTVLIGNTFEGTFLGDIAEIIVFNTALTTSQRASVEAYLAAKWSISGVHAPATASSDPVGYWADKSGNGRHAVQSLAGSRPSRSVAINTRSAVLLANGAVQRLTANGVYMDALGDDANKRITIFAALQSSSQSQQKSIGEVDQGSGFGCYHNISNIAYFDAGAGAPASRASGALASSVITGGAIFIGRRDGGVVDQWYNGALIAGSLTSATGSLRTAGDNPFSVKAVNSGSLAYGEVLIYNRALTTAERQRAERYLAARWGITLAPQVSNADAQDWIDRVYANGGTVSSATAASVNQLCDSLDASGVRPLMYRMGIFAGSNLNAALVPLYRGPSLGGTQYGNATDTNVGGLFVSANYNETGASGGLAGNGSNKYLNTGFPTNTLSASDRHLAAYPITWPNGGYQYFLGSETAAGTSQQFALGHFDYADKGSFAFGPNVAASYLTSTTAISSGGMWIGVNTSGSGTIYRNGVANGTLSLTAATPTASEIFAFAVNRASTPGAANYFNGRIGGYSIGLSMTAGQAAAYYTAMQSFQAALTRNV